MDMIRAEAVSRSFGKGRRTPRTRALDGVSLTVSRGEIVGLLGPNGAGKTTLIRILSTVLLPDAGRADIAGVDVAAHPREAKRHLGVVFTGAPGLFLRLSVRHGRRTGRPVGPWV